VQTGNWHHWDPEPSTQPTYRFDAIEALLREIDELDACWQRWFEHEGIEPLKLAYESVLADPRAETLRVLEFLSVELPPEVFVRPLTLARPNGSGDDWAERYRDEKGSRN